MLLWVSILQSESYIGKEVELEGAGSEYLEEFWSRT